MKSVYKLGWHMGAIAAVASPEVVVREGPGHGGVAVMRRRHLHHRPLTPDLKTPVQAEEHQGRLTQWTATTVRMLGTDVVIATVYLAPGQGLAN